MTTTATILRGPRGTATQAQLTEEQQRAFPAQLALWLVDAPAYHPLWHHYVCSVCHLRDVPGAPAASLRYPGAAYEINVFAARFERPADAADPGLWFRNVLMPQNICHQFHGVADVGAAALLERLVRAYCYGRLSPDTDYRGMQLETLHAWAAEAVNQRRRVN